MLKYLIFTNNCVNADPDLGLLPGHRDLQPLLRAEGLDGSKRRVRVIGIVGDRGGIRPVGDRQDLPLDFSMSGQRRASCG